MVHSIDEFLSSWKFESDATLKILDVLTDASLAQKVTPEGRSLGRLAWHVTLAPGEMLRHAGMGFDGPPDDAPVPKTAREIHDTYERSCKTLVAALPKTWTDAMLAEKVPMYGQEWARGMVLSVLMVHQTHHRGQMTVLMRQAGLRVPGIYGPAKEDWASMNMPPQE
jgi:uncharacterized damage-inducible protein DinB